MKGNGLRVYAIAYLVFLYAPIALLPLFAFNDGTIIAFPLQGFTTKWFSELWSNSALHAAVGNSLFIALMTAIFSTLLGICAARAGAMASFPGKKGITGFIMLPLVLPEIIVAVSLLIVLRQVFDVQLSNWTIIMAHVLICTPFSIAILNGAFQNIDPALEEAALDLARTGGMRSGW
jgi:spermidine/putrescine transport system permease protein